jgi:hypothetical protein
MPATPTAALSIHHFINSVGADAGFASIIGLAVMVLLFFSSARETANLRRRADDAEEQVQQLVAYVDQIARSRVQAPAPAPAPASAQTTGAPVAAPPAAARLAAKAVTPTGAPVAVPEPIPAGALATLPVAPAGVGAPALSAATRLIPLPELDEISIRALKPSTNGQTASDATQVGVATAEPPNPAPSTAAGGANGASHNPAPPVPPIQRTPPPRVPLRRPEPPLGRPPAVAPAAAPRQYRTAGGGRGVSRLVIALGGLLAIAAIVVVALIVTGSGSSPASSSSSSSSAAASRTSATKTAKGHKRPATAAAAAPVTPASVTVSVLNGTPTTNLAHDVMAKLTAAGFKQGDIATASDQTLTSTIVGYVTSSQRKDALAVAKSLSLGPASVQGVNPSDRAVACSSTPSSCTAQVIVTVGADLASNG